MNLRKFLLLALMLPAAGAWAQGNLGSLPKEVDVKDVIVTKVEYAIFSSHDSICVNPKTGQQDTLTVDEGMEIVTPEVFQAKREAKTAAIKKLVQQAKNRRALAPSVNADSDWHYEGQQERSMAQLYYYTYPSVDADGNPVRLSAMMGIPVNTVLEDYFDIISSTFSVFPWGNKIAPDWKVRPSNVVIGCHVTITSNWECPTSYESYGNSSLLGLDNFMTDAGVFSREHVDPGSQLLCRSLREDLQGDVLDMGCGWGAMTVMTLSRFAHVRMTMSDINERALELARGWRMTGRPSAWVSRREAPCRWLPTSISRPTD